MRDLQAAPSVDPYDPDSVAVYRLYNQWGALLYVGIAADPKSRFIQHECEKDWWSTVASKSVKWYPNRALAALEETRVILNDMPAYNIAGAPACPTVSASDLIEGRKPTADTLNDFYLRWLREWSLFCVSAERREYGLTVRQAYIRLFNSAKRIDQVWHWRYRQQWDEDQELRREKAEKVRLQFIERMERRAEAARARHKREWIAKQRQEAAKAEKEAARDAQRAAQAAERIAARQAAASLKAVKTALPEVKSRFNAILNEGAVQKIRQRYANGEPPVEIARHYGVSSANVKAIVRRRTWKHVPDLPPGAEPTTTEASRRWSPDSPPVPDKEGASVDRARPMKGVL